jgi:hypothetical protein
MRAVRTTISFDPQVLRSAKVVAAARGTSLSEIVEEAVREKLQQPNRASLYRPPLTSQKTGGLRPGIDVNKTSELMALMDEWDAVDRRERADKRLS